MVSARKILVTGGVLAQEAMLLVEMVAATRGYFILMSRLARLAPAVAPTRLMVLTQIQARRQIFYHAELCHSFLLVVKSVYKTSSICVRWHIIAVATES